MTQSLGEVIVKGSTTAASASGVGAVPALRIGSAAPWSNDQFANVLRKEGQERAETYLYSSLQSWGSSKGRFISAYDGNGHPAIALSVLRAPGASVEAPIDDAIGQLPLLRARFPNIRFEVSDTQKDLIDTSNANMIGALRDAIIFTCVIILFFLANWRAVATALISIPIVFLLTLGVLWLLGREMNIFVMIGIILALGMLVDDAVVVLENIERHLVVLAEDTKTAITRATEEVLSPLLIGTLATAVVIAPLMFVGGFPQQNFSHMILAVLIAVFASYFVAVTVIPRLSAFWYRNGLPPRSRFERATKALYQRSIGPGAAFYLRLLGFAARGGAGRRFGFLLAPFLLLIASFGTVMPLIGQESLPAMDSGIARVHVQFGTNQPVASAEHALSIVERELMQDPRVISISAAFGSEPGILSLGSGQLPSEVTMNVIYVNRFERKETSWQLETDLRRRIAQLPGVVSVDVFDGAATPLGTIRAPVDIRLRSEDWRTLPVAAQRVKTALQSVPGFSSVKQDWDEGTVEINLALDEDKLRSFQLTPQAVFANLPLKGAAQASISKLSSMGAIPVQIYLQEPYRSNVDALRLLPIPLPNGEFINLGEISHVVYRSTPSKLTTDGLAYSLDVLAYRDRVPTSFLSARATAAAAKALVGEVSFSDQGDNAESIDSRGRMLTGLAIGILLLFAILTPAYGSISLALLSILILPLSVIGAVWGLLAFDKSFALPAILGIILLFSIIIKNSILMVDFIQTLRRSGETARSAAMEAVKLRYRPILMTAFGTIAGMIPIALQVAIGLERISQLADAAIGGLLVGTALSLFYLPMLYVWLSGRMRAEPEEPPSSLPLESHEDLAGLPGLTTP